MNDRVIKNPNFKNNGEFHRSLMSKGIGAKDWPNTHTEAEYLGAGKFAASISVGHRVFFDKADGNKPKKHKLTDERSNGKDYVLIQGAKCCVEIYPYYAKYFDVNHEEVRLYEERWVVQRLFKEPDEWRDVDAYSPIMTVEEIASRVIVAVTYTTDYGVLIVKYVQEDNNTLRHSVSFKNTSSGTETFRVLQRWAGIVADKVDGEEISAPAERFRYGFRFEKAGRLQLGENLSSFIPTWQEEAEAAKKMWIRHGECNRCGECCLGCPHYTEEHPRCKIYETRPNYCKEFPWEPDQIKNIPECTYSFEATGIIASPTKLKPTILDVHSQGLKADFIYERWTVAPNEAFNAFTIETKPPTSCDGGWSNCANAGADDSSYAEATTDGQQGEWSGYGFSLAAGCPINHVWISIKHYTLDSSKHSISLEVWNGSAWGAPHSVPATETPCTEDIIDVSGDFSWTAEMVNAIKVRLTANIGGGSPAKKKVLCCYLPVEVDYEGCPDTATLDNPTEDGYLAKTGASTGACLAAAPTRNNTGVQLEYGNLFSKSNYSGLRAYIEWDVSSIPDGSTITDTVFKYEGVGSIATDAEINPLTEEAPLGATDANLWTYCGSGVAYVDPFDLTIGVNQSQDLGAAADADLAAALAGNWFAIGFTSEADECANLAGIRDTLYSEDKTDAPTPKPTLYVVYTPPAAGLENKSANMGSKMVAAGLI